jgi:hypothetical protein
VIVAADQLWRESVGLKPVENGLGDGSFTVDAVL